MHILDDKAFYWYWINNIPGIGTIYINKLLDVFVTPKNVYHAKEKEINQIIQINRLQNSFFHSKDDKKIINSYRMLQEKGIQFIHRENELYPIKLNELADAPYGLYLKGTLPDVNKKSVAIIGARNCTRYGSEMARFFGRELAKRDISVISGLARGIDGMAHMGALESNGYTLGVLGCGIDQVYPKENYELFIQLEKMGGIISESNLGVPPKSGLFPLRNRLIAAFCDGILVVEAMDRSGTFITVDQGLELGREIFAIPGRITDKKSIGCNHLIQLGAHIITDVKDIMQILHVEAKEEDITLMNHLSQQSQKISLAPLEKMVYSCLRIEPRYLDDIIEEVRIAPQDVCMALNRMIMSGVVAETTRNYYAIRL